MKKLLHLILLLLLGIQLQAQFAYVTVSGTVTDISTGQPIYGQPVIIQSDSTGANYFNIVYTNMNGYYVDSMPMQPSQSFGMVMISTIDCQQYQHLYTQTYGTGNYWLTQNFVICYNPGACEADFSYVAVAPLTLQFYNESIGANYFPTWDFGDGTTTAAQNPMHTYAAPGTYTVTMTIGAQGTTCFDQEIETVTVGDSLGNCNASFTYYQDPANPSLVQFMDYSTGNIAYWHWDFGDGNVANIGYPGSAAITHEYSMPGVYLACLTIQGFDSLCSSTFCLPIVVDSIIGGCEAAFSFYVDPVNPFSVQFMDQSFINQPATWFWDFGDGSYSTEQNPVHIFPITTAAVPYMVCLTISSGDSSCIDTSCESIYVGYNTGCQAGFESGPLPGAYNTFQFFDTSVGNIDTWTWDFGDGTSQTISFPQSPDVTHYYQAPGMYTACLTINGSDSCVSTACSTFFVGDTIPGCQSYFTYYMDSLAGMNIVHFVDLSTGNPTQWFWDFGDGTTSTEQNPTHAFEVSGPYSVYNVCLTVMSNNNTCYDTFCKIVIVTNNQGCHADFSVTPGPAYLHLMSFEDLSTGDIISRTWDFGDGQSVTVVPPQNPNQNHYYASPGFYTVCLTILGADSCMDTKCMLITVEDTLVNCQAQYSWYPVDSTNTGTNTFQFIDLSTGNATQWYWDFGDGTVSTEQNPLHTFPSNGTYYVCLTIYGQDCQSVWCAEVQVSPGNDCASYFIYSNLGLSVNFQGFMANPTISAATFAWDFGDNNWASGPNVVHTYNNPGIYFVTLTTTSYWGGAVCTYSTSQMITVGDSTSWSQVYGQVFKGTFPLTTGMVMLLSVDTTNTFVPFVDIAMVDSSGVYYFPMVPQGNFVIYAIPFESGYLPTYYGNVLYWQDATVVSLGTPDNPYNIQLIEGDGYAAGNGSIEGELQQGDFSSSLIDKVTMLLKDEQGHVILYAQVDEAGLFEFPQLAYGTYYLYAELAGCETQAVKVVISETSPNAMITLKLSGNSILGREPQSPALEAGMVYPNPASREARIDLNLNRQTELSTTLYNDAGISVWSNTEQASAGFTTIRIPLTQLAPGIYSLRVYTTEGLMITRKLVKTN